MNEPVIITVTPEQERYCKEYREKEMVKYPADEHKLEGWRAKHHWFGTLAEHIVYQWLHGQGIEHFWHRENPRQIHDFDIYGQRVDVKNKRIPAKPTPQHCYMIDAKCRAGKADYFLFTFYRWHKREMWLMGFAPAEQFYARAELFEHGATLPISGHVLEGSAVHHVDSIAWIIPPAQWLATMAGGKPR